MYNRTNHTMQKPLLGLLLIGAWACGACAALPQWSRTLAGDSSTPSPPAAAAVVTALPSATGYPGCYYVAATRELPELSRMLDSRLQTLDSAANVSAYAYGEDCVASDGTRTFRTAETDFRVRIPVASLQDEGSLGSWIANVMGAIDALPEGQVPGPQLGRVEFEFYTPRGERLRLNIEIRRFRSEGVGLAGATLFQHFYTTP